MISFHRHVIPLLLATASSSASASSPRRLSIFSGDSIATNVLNTQQAAVGTTFTLHAKRAESGEEQAIPVVSVSTEALTAEAASTTAATAAIAGSTAAAATTATTAAAIPEDFSINVRVAEPAITSSTILLVGDGEGVYVNEADLATILVSDEEVTFAVIAVEKVENGRVDGIIHTAGGDDIKFTQGGEYGQEVSTTSSAVHIRCLYLRSFFTSQSLSLSRMSPSNSRWSPQPNPLRLQYLNRRARWNWKWFLVLKIWVW